MTTPQQAVVENHISYFAICNHCNDELEAENWEEVMSDFYNTLGGANRISYFSAAIDFETGLIFGKIIFINQPDKNNFYGKSTCSHENLDKLLDATLDYGIEKKMENSLVWKNQTDLNGNEVTVTYSSKKFVTYQEKKKENKCNIPTNVKFRMVL